MKIYYKICAWWFLVIALSDIAVALKISIQNLVGGWIFLDPTKLFVLGILSTISTVWCVVAANYKSGKPTIYHRTRRRISSVVWF